MMDSATLKNDIVAVYGTLRMGGERNNMLSSSTFLGNRRLPGYDMFDRGGMYPYIIRGEGSIIVELYRVCSETLSDLDREEDVPRLYTRSMVNIDGMDAWLYVWSGGLLDGDRQIISGDWMLDTLGPCDISFATLETPLGAMTACFAGDVLLSLLFSDRCTDEEDCLPAERRVVEEVRRELDEYFAGKRKKFTMPIHFQGTPFQKSVWNALLDIPFGEVRTYGEVAEALGKPGAQRAVGGAVGRNPVTIVVPCHRVVAAHGIGGFSCGVWRKERLLELEGVLQ